MVLNLRYLAGHVPFRSPLYGCFQLVLNSSTTLKLSLKELRITIILFIKMHRDFEGLNGHGFEDSIHHGNADFKSDYVDGYHSGWNYAKMSVNLKAGHPL
jgi:hypothetical protein